MARRAGRSISTPIILASVSVALAIALLVGWTLFIARDLAMGTDIAGNTALLVLGALAFVTILSVLVLFSVWLAREILEVRRQNSFIDSVTHELKTPLASIKLCLETLRRDEVTSEQREELRQMMIDDVARLSSFIDDVLQASRLAWHQESLSVADVDVGEVVRAAVVAACARHKIGPETVRIDAPAELVVQTDRTALEIVVRNLLDNAIKYSQDAVDVTASARLDDGRVVIEVRDRGIGIAKQHLRRVFHRFYRVPTESVRSRHGTGLGLFVVWQLVKNLGGAVVAESPGLGHGTTVRVTLPVTAAPELAPAVAT